MFNYYSSFILRHPKALTIFFFVFVLPWVLLYWFPRVIVCAALSLFFLLWGCSHYYYTENKNKVSAGGGVSRVARIFIILADFTSSLVGGFISLLVSLWEGFVGILGGIFALVILVAVVGGIVGILVFGWRQIL
jgi:hypothetical protein